MIKLLTLIRDGLYQNAANLDKTHAMIEADKRLNKFHQGDKMSVYKYREKMKSLIDICSNGWGTWHHRSMNIGFHGENSNRQSGNCQRGSQGPLARNDVNNQSGPEAIWWSHR